METFVGRQPIFDLNNTLVGYDVLYRTSADQNSASGADLEQMSSAALVHSLLGLGMEQITGGRTAFIKVTRDMLVMDLFELLDPKGVVIQLLGDAADHFTIKACERLAGAGYRLAIENYIDAATQDPILSMAEIVKVDVLGCSPQELTAIAEELRRYDVRLLAKRVETAGMYQRCRTHGFELFQGFYFSRPEVLSKTEMPIDGTAVIRIMNLLRDPSTKDEALAEAFRTSPSLSYQLLRIVNTHAHGGDGVRSIEHAIQLTGRDRLHRWLSLLFVSSLVAAREADSELTEVAIARARLCEMIARKNGQHDDAGPLFLTGLFSALDTLLDIPMDEILTRVDLAPEVRDALLEHRGPFGRTLALAKAYEDGRWRDVEQHAVATDVETTAVTDLYLQSLTWARARLKVLRA